MVREVLSALKMENISGCSLYIGPVAGSLLVREVHDSDIFVCARQLRIHDSTECNW